MVLPAWLPPGESVMDAHPLIKRSLNSRAQGEDYGDQQRLARYFGLSEM
jgi:hypothetical protein